jgi:alanine-glyoxylate transaminase/serine-glyoxylate transaminase/serine-pyruvate transaminase
MAVSRGRQFFFNPGPTNIPDRILRAMDRPAVDFKGPDFDGVAAECYAGLRKLFRTEHAIVAYAASGHGAWEASIVNLFSPGDKILVLESGHFSINWGDEAALMGLQVEVLPGDWRAGVDPVQLEKRLRADSSHELKAVMLVHNETSTGVVNRCEDVGKAIKAAGHPALLMVDVISSLGSMDFRMDEWGVDVTVGGSQKGMMLPAGMAFTAISEKALEVSKTAKMPRVYWDWRRLLDGKSQVNFPGTAPVHMFFGLAEAFRYLDEEGMPAVFARHHRLGEAVRQAVHVWRQNDGPELFATDPRTRSDSVTAIQLPEGHDAEAMRKLCLERFNVSLGGGLNKLRGRVFRIGHLGDLNEPMVLGALAAVEMTFGLAGIPHGKGGVNAAMDYLAKNPS